MSIHRSLSRLITDGHVMLDCGCNGATLPTDAHRRQSGPMSVICFLTHLHHDHVCELPFFVISSWILNRIGALEHLRTKGYASMVSHLFEGGAFDADIQRAAGLCGAAIQHGSGAAACAPNTTPA